MDVLDSRTSLIDIRDFLNVHNCSVTPWDSPKNVVERLYMALEEKKDDGFFWAELQGLVQRLEDDRFSSKTFDGSLVFQSATLEKLIDDLRLSLSGSNGNSDNRRPSMKIWLTKSLNSVALLSFLLLGTSLGCGMSGDDTVCDSAIEQGLGGNEGNVYCELVGIIQNSELPNYEKEGLISCLPELDAYVREDLLNKFQEMSDEDLAQHLKTENICDLVTYDDYNDEDWGDGDDH